MKKIITVSIASAIAALSTNAQGIIAGWDFSDVTNLAGTNVDGYERELGLLNNGVATTGSITTSLTQGSQVSFASNGSQATGVQFNDGFDTTTSDTFGGAATGQQALNILSAPSSSFTAFDINFTSAYDVVLNFDWLNSDPVGSNFGDFINISYSADGINFQPFALPGSTAAGGYGAFASTSAWGKTTDTTFYNFLNQTDAVVDLTSVTPDAGSTIQAIRIELEGVGIGDRIGFDNIHVAGTAVPEPSAYAAIVGVLAIGFVAVRRRR